MNIKYFNKGSMENIIKIENDFNVKLPSDYKEFLIQHNGAIIKKSTFYVKDLDQNIMMNILFGISHDNRVFNIEYWNKEYGEDIPPNSLLIGNDPGGTFLLLVFDGENDGVWFYDDSYFFEQSTDDLNTYFICETFSDFVKLLETTSEE
jgi:hypothetical protein